MAVIGVVLTLACMATYVDGFMASLATFWGSIVEATTTLLGSIF